MTDTKTLKLTGPFTDAEVVEFIALLRRIDEANPANVYVAAVYDPSKSVDEAERFVTQTLPPASDRITTFARAMYRDDSYPPRQCDRCGGVYRGPAVYCSYACAIADA